MEGRFILQAKSISETKRARYLLGLSSPVEREQIESEYFEDDDAFQQMLTTEDDLIDAYARGELVGDELLSFEKRFASSTCGRARAQFARAFAGAVSGPQPMEIKRPATFFKIIQSASWLRIAAVIVFVALLAWLISDFRRMTIERREWRAESAEFSKRIAALQQSSDTERTRTAEIGAQLTDLRAHPDIPRSQERATAATQRARHRGAYLAGTRTDQADITPGAVEGLKNGSLLPRNTSSSGTTIRGTAKDPQGKVVSGATVTLTDPVRNFTRTQHTDENGAYIFNEVPPGTYSIVVMARGFKTASASGIAALVDTPIVRDMQLEVGAVSDSVDVTAAAEAAINTSDTTLGNSFERKHIAELPLNANNVAALLSLQPSISRTGSVNGGRADQSNITLDGVDLNTLNTYSLTPRTTNSRNESTIPLPSFLSWIRFQLALETVAIHEDYRITIKTADGHPVTSVYWIEPLTPNQNIIDTPAISTGDLPSGTYVLLLMGKEPSGSFIKVAEYAFKVIKY